MTDLVPVLAVLVPGLPVLGAVLVQLPRQARGADRVNVAVTVPSAVAALLLAGIALAHGGAAPLVGDLYLVDGAGGVFLALIAVVGLCSALLSPAYLRTTGAGWFRAERARHRYYGALHLFWGALFAVAIAGNLAIAWLLVEATTAASALLVAFTGRRDALEAGWKYLVLTTLGLSVSLLGIVVLALGSAGTEHGGLGQLDWHALPAAADALAGDTALLAFVLVLAGLATKIGWAPVHNWLPDAHSEAPAPVSALLSAALLPTVMLVAWRVKDALAASVGKGTATALFLGFGLASLLVAVPFLLRALPWKRLLAYSSLEHMGVLALGIGFGTPLAIAGVVLHVAGHGLAKALGFYAALPLLRAQPEAARRAPAGVASASPPTAAAMGVSLASLGGLPPFPLFISEVLILLGGVAAGQTVVVAVAAVALALGFLGLLHAFVEGVVGEAGGRRARPSRSERPIAVLTAGYGGGLLALTVLGVLALPDSALVETLARGVS